jgi:hypothetical protein
MLRVELLEGLLPALGVLADELHLLSKSVAALLKSFALVPVLDGVAVDSDLCGFDRLLTRAILGL